MTFSGLAVNQVKQILDLAEYILAFIIKNDEGQKGGVLCVAEPKTGLSLLTCVFGTLPEEEVRQYTEFATEKAERLAKSDGHFTSWQSRDLSANRYGGAVLVGEFILSFSGFKEEQDEAAMLVLAMNLGVMDGGPAAILAQMSKNQYFRKLQNACSTENPNPLDRFRFVDEKHP